MDAAPSDFRRGRVISGALLGPRYSPDNPPARLINALDSGRTGEFHDDGLLTKGIVNYFSSEDVAALEVTCTLPSNPGDNCKPDLDHDGVVGGSDLALLLASWGQQIAGDLTHDDVIDGSDMAIMLAGWGACP
jgi:hypothetical protein